MARRVWSGRVRHHTSMRQAFSLREGRFHEFLGRYPRLVCDRPLACTLHSGSSHCYANTYPCPRPRAAHSFALWLDQIPRPSPCPRP
jgi:hypothetical protein